MKAIEALGRRGIDFLRGLGRAGDLFLRMLLNVVDIFLHPRELTGQLYAVGVLSLLIIAVSGLFVGMVLGLQGYYILTQFGAESALGTMVATSLLRELGPDDVRRHALAFPVELEFHVMVGGLVGLATTVEMGDGMVAGTAGRLHGTGQ